MKGMDLFNFCNACIFDLISAASTIASRFSINLASESSFVGAQGCSPLTALEGRGVDKGWIGGISIHRVHLVRRLRQARSVYISVRGQMTYVFAASVLSRSWSPVTLQSEQRPLTLFREIVVSFPNRERSNSSGTGGCPDY